MITALMGVAIISHSPCGNVLDPKERVVEFPADSIAVAILPLVVYKETETSGPDTNVTSTAILPKYTTVPGHVGHVGHVGQVGHGQVTEKIAKGYKLSKL